MHLVSLALLSYVCVCVVAKRFSMISTDSDKPDEKEKPPVPVYEKFYAVLTPIGRIHTSAPSHSHGGTSTVQSPSQSIAPSTQSSGQSEPEKENKEKEKERTYTNNYMLDLYHKHDDYASEFQIKLACVFSEGKSESVEIQLASDGMGFDIMMKDTASQVWLCVYA